MLCKNATLCKPKLAWFSCASATASALKSTPMICAFSPSSWANASAIAPVPVPKSKICKCACVFNRLLAQFSACSTKHSVSGRGISVCGEVFKVRDQNSFSPKIYAIGSPCTRRANNVASCAFSDSVNSVSPKAKMADFDRFVTACNSKFASVLGLR